MMQKKYKNQSVNSKGVVLSILGFGLRLRSKRSTRPRKINFAEVLFNFKSVDVFDTIHAVFLFFVWHWNNKRLKDYKSFWSGS